MDFQDLTLDRRGDVFIITLQRSPENRLTVDFCDQIIRAFHYVQRTLGTDSPGAVITRGSDAKFWCTGVDLKERETNPFANSDGFYPMLHTILDFPFPTIALLTGHTFGGACPFALAHDYRIMNSERGFFCMVSLYRTYQMLRFNSPIASLRLILGCISMEWVPCFGSSSRLLLLERCCSRVIGGRVRKL
jgi:enoyl-CoA hydratase/carnithine racemase